jgi:hypothetical protein
MSGPLVDSELEALLRHAALIGRRGEQPTASYLQVQAEQGDAWRSLERAFASHQAIFDDWRAVLEAARGAGRFSFQTGRVLQDVVTASS